MNPARRVAAAASAVAAVHALSALGHAFGTSSDEAFHVRLALALWRGSFSLPGPFGGPITDPLPGYPLLLAAPARALAGHWGSFRALGLAATLSAAWLTWRLARALLSERSAAAASLFVALSPALVSQAGVALPDAAFAAVSTACFLEISRAEASVLPLFVLGAFGSLLRPYGALLPLSVSFGYALRRGYVRGAWLAAGSLMPLSVWLLRNRAVSGSATAYAPHWLSQASLADLPARLLAVAADILGRGAAGVPAWPGLPAAAAGLVLVGLAARGARRLLSGRHRPVCAAMTVFAAALLLLHLGWGAATPRYALPLLTPLWLLAAAGWDVLPRAALALPAVLAVSALAADAALARPAFSPQPPAFAALGARARADLPEDARLESFACQPLELMAARPVECAQGRRPRELWIAHLLRARIAFVHEGAWSPDGYFPSGLERFAAERRGWLADAADFEEVFADPRDGALYRLKPRDEARYLAAETAFIAATAALARGDGPAMRSALETAVRLNPRFANAWAMLALSEKDPARAAALMRRAADADPGSADAAAEAARLEAAARSR